jgi:hypothetical protein
MVVFLPILPLTMKDELLRRPILTNGPNMLKKELEGLESHMLVNSISHAKRSRLPLRM